VPLNTPVILTLARVAVIPMVLVLMLFEGPGPHHAAAILFVVASFTDWLDGFLARRWGQTSAFGAFLDPVADKLLVGVSLVMVMHWHSSGWMSVLVAIIIGREITISALREWLAELGERTRVAVNWVGKLKTVAQMTSIALMLWETAVFNVSIYDVGEALLFGAAALTLWSMGAYLRAAWPVLRRG
jgi:CDP-diacylglycerol--glycerol-3-phosphate 3-phosphatidyltransferase